MKKIIALLITLSVFMSLTPLYAMAEEEMKFELSENGEYYIFSWCHTQAESFDIPDSYNGLPVKEIGYGAFSSCERLDNVTLPDSIETLSDAVFRDCSHLKSIKLPKNIEIIPDFTFFECKDLKEIVIPSKVVSIGDRAFAYCESLETINLPESVIDIGRNSFEGCDSLIYNSYEGCLYLPVQDNPYKILIACEDEYERTEYKIHENTVIIGNNAFKNAIMLKKVIIPENVSVIGEFAFDSCYGLESVVISQGVEIIDRAIFANCSSLKTIYCEASKMPDGWNEKWKEYSSAVVVFGYGTEQQFMVGDLDGNGKFGAADYFKLKRELIDPSDIYDISRCDVNCDGEFSALDYFQLKRHVLYA